MSIDEIAAAANRYARQVTQGRPGSVTGHSSRYLGDSHTDLNHEPVRNLIERLIRTGKLTPVL